MLPFIKEFSFMKLRLWVLVLLLSFLASCNSSTQGYYSVEQQFNLSTARLENMKNLIIFSISFENNQVKQEEKIYFLAAFTNLSNKPIILRKPKQHGVLEIHHANTTLLFSISPSHDEKSFWYPNEYLGYELAMVPVQENEFVKLNPSETIRVRLEFPTRVFLKKNEQVSESGLPAGEYLLNMKYQNHYIGYEVEQNDRIMYKDINAWVGEIEAEPVLLVILP